MHGGWLVCGSVQDRLRRVLGWVGKAVCRFELFIRRCPCFSRVQCRNVRTRAYAQHTRCPSDPGIKRIQTWKISWKFVNSTEGWIKGWIGYLGREPRNSLGAIEWILSLSLFSFLSLSLFLFGHTIDCAHRWQWNVIGIRTGSGGARLIDFVRDKISFLQFLASVLLWRSLYWADVLTEIQVGEVFRAGYTRDDCEMVRVLKIRDRMDEE